MYETTESAIKDDRERRLYELLSMPCSLFLQASRPISMKKEGIQSRNRKLSAKARKKHSSFTSAADMLKPLEKMYGYGMAGMAGMAGSAMSSYYGMPNPTGPVGAAGIPSLHNSASPSAAAASHQYAAASAAAGMHMMAASTLGGFGAAAAPSFGGMVSLEKTKENGSNGVKRKRGRGNPLRRG